MPKAHCFFPLGFFPTPGLLLLLRQQKSLQPTPCLTQEFPITVAVTSAVKLFSFAKMPTSHPGPFQKHSPGLSLQMDVQLFHPLLHHFEGPCSCHMAPWRETLLSPSLRADLAVSPHCPVSPPTIKQRTPQTSHQLCFCYPLLPFQSLHVSHSTVSLITFSSGIS